MNAPMVFGLCAALLIGVGLFGAIAHPHPLRKILAFNVVGSGVFVMLGAIARRGAAGNMGADPVPQALLITAIVVAFAATALALALLLRLFEPPDPSRSPAMLLPRKKPRRATRKDRGWCRART